MSLARRRQDALLARIRCPRCTSPMGLTTIVDVDGLIGRGDLRCVECDAVTVRLQDHQFVALADLWRSQPTSLDAAVRVDLGREQLDRRGRWAEANFFEIADGTDSEAASVVVNGPMLGIEFVVRKHPWSGIAEVLFDDEVVASYDLYSPGLDRFVIQHANDSGAATCTLRTTSDRHPASRGHQIVLDAVAVFVDAQDAGEPSFAPIERGNPHPPRFLEMVAEEPAGAFILDCGGGDRRIGDPRIFNLEYGRAASVDIVADCEHLPLADASVDLLLSQAVLEHVTRPHVAAAEILRVLRPGGRALIDVAFTQPYHPVPDHFFNHTPSALRLLFGTGTRVIDEHTFGGLEDTMRWLAEIAAGDGRDLGGSDQRLIEAAHRFDDVASDVVLRHFASGASIEIERQ